MAKYQELYMQNCCLDKEISYIVNKSLQQGWRENEAEKIENFERFYVW